MSARSRAATPPSNTPGVAARTIEPTEAAMMDTIVAAAKITGWRCSHFRPARDRHGRWHTPVQGDGVGFPDVVLCHPRRRLLWFAELKTQRGRLTVEQEAWGADLSAAGARYLLVRGRAGLTALLDEMAAP